MRMPFPWPIGDIGAFGPVRVCLSLRDQWQDIGDFRGMWTWGDVREVHDPELKCVRQAKFLQKMLKFDIFAHHLSIFPKKGLNYQDF